MKRQLIVLGLSGALLGAGIVGAQQDGGTATDDQTTQSQPTTEGTAAVADTQIAAMVAQRLLHRSLDMGSTLSVTFYDGDPEAGGSELSSLEFVYGEDSEAAFAEQVETAASDASYITVTTSPQTETYNLSELGSRDAGGFGGGRFGNRGPGGFGQDGFGGQRH